MKDFIDLISLSDDDFQDEIYTLLKEKAKIVGKIVKETNLHQLLQYYNEKENKFNSPYDDDNKNVLVLIPDSKLFYTQKIIVKKPLIIEKIKEQNVKYYKENNKNTLKALLEKYDLDESMDYYFENYMENIEDDEDFSYVTKKLELEERHYTLEELYKECSKHEICKYNVIDQKVYVVLENKEHSLETLDRELNKVYSEKEVKKIIKRYVETSYDDLFKYYFY